MGACVDFVNQKPSLQHPLSATLVFDRTSPNLLKNITKIAGRGLRSDLRQMHHPLGTRRGLEVLKRLHP